MSQNPLVITQEEFESFLTILKNRTGIVPRASHRDGIKAYIEKKMAEKKLSVITFKNELLVNEGLFTELVNESTVNETYFFREERQFALLRDKIFPSWKKDFAPARIKIWSAACSYGEEAYSLALLAKAAGLNASVLASDINSIVLNHCKKGIFSGSSIRPVDGLAFQDLLLPYRKDDMSIEFDEQIKACIKTQKINLSTMDLPETSLFLPKNQNIIFLRNVFIYFNPELRAKILHTIAEKCLADGGLLFVSMSEIAQLGRELVPPSLEKVVDGSVFYFRKKGEKSNV
ncbi:CheR family methyltransferase [Treponema sp.]|uniref:CheR family methyltransferase n=1 Tax=Treponema sp. TaxID=166 RepID=UPI0025EAE818|nr:CheR family methyltransferase [Treponema sp.]MBR4322060.1 hypothetical protein [Treponema sp.]